MAGDEVDRQVRTVGKRPALRAANALRGVLPEKITGCKKYNMEISFYGRAPPGWSLPSAITFYNLTNFFDFGKPGDPGLPVAMDPCCNSRG
jgi:hypothetical protein